MINNTSINEVTYGGQQCINVNANTLSAITCDLPVNNSKFQIFAGDLLPKIHILNRGYVTAD